MLTDFKGNPYGGIFQTFRGTEYDGKLYDFKGNLIDGGADDFDYPSNISTYFRPNYKSAYQWLEARSGLVRGIIVTDTHYGAGEWDSSVSFSNSVRVAKAIQARQDDVLFFHLGDIIDDPTVSFTQFENDGAGLYPNRSMYISGNHEHQNATSQQIAAVNSTIWSYMSNVSTLVENGNAVIYKDVGNVRFFGLNMAFRGVNSGAIISSIKEAGSPDYFVILSHCTPHLTTPEGQVWSTGPAMSGVDNLHNAIHADAVARGKFIGHWTGHNHHDGLAYYDPNGSGYSSEIVTFCCDYYRKLHTTWRSKKSTTEGSFVCFCIRPDSNTVEFQRFGGIRPGDIDKFNFTHWSYNWATHARQEEVT